MIHVRAHLVIRTLLLLVSFAASPKASSSAEFRAIDFPSFIRKKRTVEHPNSQHHSLDLAYTNDRVSMIATLQSRCGPLSDLSRVLFDVLAIAKSKGTSAKDVSSECLDPARLQECRVEISGHENQTVFVGEKALKTIRERKPGSQVEMKAVFLALVRRESVWCALEVASASPEDPIATYRKLLDTLPTNKAASIDQALNAYKTRFGKASDDEKDQAYVALREFYYEKWIPDFDAVSTPEEARKYGFFSGEGSSPDESGLWLATFSMKRTGRRGSRVSCPGE